MRDVRNRLSIGNPRSGRRSRSGPLFEELETRHMLAASVLGRHIFYNGSKYDGGSTAINASDDLAIATDKAAYLAGSGAATFSSITSYARGINGIMIDVDDLAGAVTAADFTFQMSTQGSANNAPSQWEAAPAPSAVSLRPGAGAGGSDRLVITWAHGAISNRWLRVVFEGNDTLGSFNTNTGLNQSDVFYFGNRVGDDGSGTPTLAVTSAIDELAARNNPGAGATVTNLHDFDRSGVVNATDAITARNNSGTLTKINLAAPITIELTSLVPFTIDLTPQLTATTSSAAIMPNFTVFSLDVDLNNDGDFGDPGEVNYTSAMFYQGTSTFYVTPGLPAVPTNYDIKLRIRATGNDGLESISDTLNLEVDTQMSNALQNYVNAPDESYYYTLANTVVGSGYTFYVLDMTSQSWRSSSEVNMPDWRHWVEVVVPNGALSDTALLYITGGNNNFGSPPSSPDSSMLSLALATGTVTVRLRTVPSEPLVFSDEGFSRSEDEIIAYSFDKFLENIGQPGNDNWPVLVAMAKSAVRAMDTVEDFLPTVRPGEQIEDYVVTGYSKRGWTTWLTAAADDRVRAIIPGVIDVLNQGPQMVHHYNVYGFFSPAIHDYQDMEIFERILTPEAQLLSQIVDPYRYLHNGRFDDMPKLLINSAGDEFFVSDSAQYYFSDIPGSDNYLRYLPNTGHSLDSRATESTYSFYEAILNNRTLPEFSWTVSPDGQILVHADTAPLSVRLWQATNPSARDFRRAYNPSINWTSSIIASGGGGNYVGNVPLPVSGARAYFVELTFDHPTPGVPDYVFTTEIRIKTVLPLYDWPYPTGAPPEGAAAAAGFDLGAVALAVEVAAPSPAASVETASAQPSASAPIGSRAADSGAALALAVDLAWAEEEAAEAEASESDVAEVALMLLDDDWS